MMPDDTGAAPFLTWVKVVPGLNPLNARVHAETVRDTLHVVASVRLPEMGRK